MLQGLLELFRPAATPASKRTVAELLDQVEEGVRPAPAGSAYHSLGAISGGGYWP